MDDLIEDLQNISINKRTDEEAAGDVSSISPQSTKGEKPDPDGLLCSTNTSYSISFGSSDIVCSEKIDLAADRKIAEEAAAEKKAREAAAELEKKRQEEEAAAEKRRREEAAIKKEEEETLLADKVLQAYENGEG